MDAALKAFEPVCKSPVAESCSKEPKCHDAACRQQRWRGGTRAVVHHGAKHWQQSSGDSQHRDNHSQKMPIT